MLLGVGYNNYFPLLLLKTPPLKHTTLEEEKRRNEQEEWRRKVEKEELQLFLKVTHSSRLLRSDPGTRKTTTTNKQK
jgi:hypothetical protein